MIPLSSAKSDRLTWSKTPDKRRYDLKRHGEVVGSFRRVSCWSSELHVESAHGQWEFRRTGFFRSGTEVVDARSNARVALLQPNLSGGGRLEFCDGSTFRIARKGFWRPVWTVWTESKQPVLSVRPCEQAVDLPEGLLVTDDRLILLTIFTWHIMRQASEDAASVAALVAATS